MLEMFNYSTFIIALIMFTLVGLGIINTMFMAIFERHYEFGILLAIGTKPHTLFKQVLLEGTMIALISIVLGNLVAGICNILGAKYGIHFMTDLEVSGLTLNEPIYLQPSVESCILLSLSLLIITLLACIYPARYGAGLSPAIAMRRSS
jgi:ABC-type antimicrobial peptide transport system permease subunit